MKVVAVNIGEEKVVSWRGKPVITGIFKYPVSGSIVLGETDVEGDHVIDRRYHGVIDKACYLYSADWYKEWKERYPDLDWDYGMFGENITVEGLNEKQIQIGDIFQIGPCRVQVTQPRQPCFKLGIRFGTQKILKDFIASKKSGVYVKIIDGGAVQAEDEMRLSERLHNTIGLQEVWDLLYSTSPDHEQLEFAIHSQHLAEACKESLRKKLK